MTTSTTPEESGSPKVAPTARLNVDALLADWGSGRSPIRIQAPEADMERFRRASTDRHRAPLRVFVQPVKEGIAVIVADDESQAASILNSQLPENTPTKGYFRPEDMCGVSRRTQNMTTFFHPTEELKLLRDALRKVGSSEPSVASFAYNKVVDFYQQRGEEL